MHVTARAVRLAPNLRSQSLFGALRAIFARSSEKGFRLLHFSVQGNHLHLVVEADDDVAFARGIQRLLSRAAMVVNDRMRMASREVPGSPKAMATRQDESMYARALTWCPDQRESA